ncbi:hypothetical protein BAUCODRAFT_391092 [Baudoinia panamericana UAMH 10762]|uniref:D-xylose 1-dehydrogenase (NADP(+), D-xylono-1,5-lactone-forming) n=1 Tax=Baudoinia panamericana (strain UAMH 10762) TaxID=717646 RepID=M2NJ15_BAUPA|nr:uncharacterized protein BAUCODRAFT_391092 [Baudoinia panamericana UAMH 10762]EMC99095.1 hypothetical protein BAUCODRAFT_391092 [Baudoinia panamericana UAMH 10762]
MAEMPICRWGIVATGGISEQFVRDLLMSDWPEKKANHIIQAIGSSSLEKCKSFAATCVTPAKPAVQPALYGSYQEVYDDKNVDCVYIGTPHSFHKRNCLDAIEAGKNILCEKPFALNATEAEEVFAAAKEKGVFVMEAFWTRFYPLIKTLQRLLHEERKLGTIYRTFCDFGLDIDISSLPETSRYKDPALGAGSLLDIGIYSITWGLMTLSPETGDNAEQPDVSSTQTVIDGVDVASQVLLHFRSTGRQGICTSTTTFECMHPFARLEGSEGRILVDGSTPSSPRSFTFYPKDGGKEERYEFEKPGKGFWWEADAVAQDLQAGRKQNQTMPWAETLRVLSIMDGVRKRSGTRFPVDAW